METPKLTPLDGQPAIGRPPLTVQEIISQHRLLTNRLAPHRERFDLALGLLNEVNLDQAVTTAAQSIAQTLTLDQCVPALAKAALLATLRDKLITALRVELIGSHESALAEFTKENESILRAHGAI